MIQQIVITDYLCQAANQPMTQIRALLNHLPQLARANWQVKPLPATAVCLAKLRSAHAAASPTAVASLLAQRLHLPTTPAFCLLPVELHVQRDTYSLQGTVALSATQYQSLTAMLAAQFVDDFVLQTDPSQQYWWVTPHQTLQADSRWPQACLYQSAFAWQPQGAHGGVLRQWSNEMQMLLHLAQQGSQPAITAQLPDTLNGLWFAGVGELPTFAHTYQYIAGRGDLFLGLCAAGLERGQRNPQADSALDPATQQTPLTLDTPWIGASSKAEQLWIVDTQAQIDWPALNAAITAKQIKTLQLVLPFAERHLEVTLKAPRWWQRWQPHPDPEAIVQQCQAALSAAH